MHLKRFKSLSVLLSAALILAAPGPACMKAAAQGLAGRSRAAKETLPTGMAAPGLRQSASLPGLSALGVASPSGLSLPPSAIPASLPSGISAGAAPLGEAAAAFAAPAERASAPAAIESAGRSPASGLRVRLAGLQRYFAPIQNSAAGANVGTAIHGFHSFYSNSEKQDAQAPEPAPAAEGASGSSVSAGENPRPRRRVNLNRESVAKKVGALSGLSESQPAQAKALALLTLRDENEDRMEVRISALRTFWLSSGPDAAPVLGELVVKDRDYYIRRQAARYLGQRPSEIVEGREAAVAALHQASVESNVPVRLMARWALGRFGEKPAPEPADPDEPEKAKPAKTAADMADAYQGTSYRGGTYRSDPDFKPGWVPKFLVFLGLFGVFLYWVWVNAHSAPISSGGMPSWNLPQSPVFWFIAAGFVQTLLLIFAMIWINRRPGVVVNQANVSPPLNAKPRKPTTKFDDVAGIDDARSDLVEMVDILRDAKRCKRLGGRVPKGVLLVGPPGTGKTLTARAVAGEAEVPFFEVSASDFVRLFVGAGADRVRQLFKEVRDAAPAILFIDEIDAVGKARGSSSVTSSHDEREQTLNQILTEMDGFATDTGVIVMAATNRPDILDPAIVRPGRFDRTVYLGAPDILGREAILQTHAKSVRLDPEADLAFVARRTPGLTGAYLMNIMNEAALVAARRQGDTVTAADLAQAVDRVLVGQKRSTYIDPPAKERISYHEIGHVLAKYLAGGSVPAKVTNIPHGASALGFADLGEETEKFIHTEADIEAAMMGILGGLAAEMLIYGNKSTGPSNDLERATEIARKMVTVYGMGPLGLMVSAPRSDSPFAERRVSEETQREIDVAIRDILKAAYDRTIGALTTHRDALVLLTQALIAKETLDHDQIEKLLPPRAPVAEPGRKLP